MSYQPETPILAQGYYTPGRYAFQIYHICKIKYNCSSEIHVFRSDQFSILIYRCLLPSSVTVNMDYEENMENARFSANDDTPL